MAVSSHARNVLLGTYVCNYDLLDLEHLTLYWKSNPFEVGPSNQGTIRHFINLTSPPKSQKPDTPASCDSFTFVPDQEMLPMVYCWVCEKFFPYFRGDESYNEFDYFHSLSMEHKYNFQISALPILYEIDKVFLGEFAS